MVSKQKKKEHTDIENEWGITRAEGFNVYRIYLWLIKKRKWIFHTILFLISFFLVRISKVFHITSKLMPKKNMEWSFFIKISAFSNWMAFLMWHDKFLSTDNNWNIPVGLNFVILPLTHKEFYFFYGSYFKRYLFCYWNNKLYNHNFNLVKLSNGNFHLC